MKWIGNKLFVPPYGEFSQGDDVSHLPDNVLLDLESQGLVSSLVGAALPDEAPIVAPDDEEI